MESTSPSPSPSLPPPSPFLSPPSSSLPPPSSSFPTSSSTSPSPSLVTSDPTSQDPEHLDWTATLTLPAAGSRGGVSDVSELGVGVAHPEYRSSSGVDSSKLEPLQRASASCIMEVPGDATPKNCLQGVRKLPPLAEAADSWRSCDNTSHTMMKDDVTALKPLTQQAFAADSRQGQGGHTQHHVSLGPAEEASGCSTSGQVSLETARLAAYPPHPNPQPLPPGKSFHVFFSYCWRDAAWVRRMVEVLETEHGLRCCYHERDFKPGATVIQNINLHTEQSVKTALVVSPAFLESEWGSYEAEVVMHLSVDQRRRLLVPVLLQQCQLPRALRPLTYIDATVPAFLDRFLAAILVQDESVHDRPLLFGRTDLFFNPNTYFYNLEHLCDVSSKWTCLQGETFAKTNLPEVLMRRGLTMTEKEQKKVIARLTTASSLPCSGICDHAGFFRLCFCCLALSCVAALILGPMFLASSKSSVVKFSIGLSLVVFSVAVLWFGIIPCLSVTPFKRWCLRKAMVEVNRIYLRHQLIASLLTRRGFCRRYAQQLKVYYFDPRPCLDHLASYLSSRPSPSTQWSDGGDEQLLEVEMSAGRRGQGSANQQPGGDDVELLIPDEDVEGTEEERETSAEERQALKLLLDYSQDYMKDYIHHKLPVCKRSRHVRQVPCLCQFVERKMADRNAPTFWRLLCQDFARLRHSIHQLWWQ